MRRASASHRQWYPCLSTWDPKTYQTSRAFIRIQIDSVIQSTRLRSTTSSFRLSRIKIFVRLSRYEKTRLRALSFLIRYFRWILETMEMVMRPGLLCWLAEIAMSKSESTYRIRNSFHRCYKKISNCQNLTTQRIHRPWKANFWSNRKSKMK